MSLPNNSLFSEQDSPDAFKVPAGAPAFGFATGPGEVHRDDEYFAQGLGVAARANFLLGRTAARRALVRVGAPDLPVPRGPGGEPVFPPGTCGSISHTGGLAVASAASEMVFESLGVDVERKDRVFREDIDQKIATEVELEYLRCGDGDRRVKTLGLLTAKEAAFKAFYPVGHARLMFHDAEFTRKEGGYEGRLLCDASKIYTKGTLFQVHVIETRDFLFAWVGLRRDS